MEYQASVIRDFYNDIASEYAEEWYCNSSFKGVLESFVSLFPNPPKILDMGCGAGYHCMTLSLLGADTTGIDFSDKAVEIARTKNPYHRFEVMDFRDMDSTLGCFDGIVSIATFMHIPDDNLPAVFRRISLILNDGGYFLLVINDGGMKERVNFHYDNNGQCYDFINFYHGMKRINELAHMEGLSWIDEWKLPEEHSARGWKCFLYQSRHIKK